MNATPYNSIESNRRWNSAEKFGNDGGEFWSQAWGGSNYLWLMTLLPRLAPFLPVQTLVEIAPGFGRITSFIQQFTDRYIGVDLNEKCIEACTQRFANESKMQFYVNDGKSLPMISDESVDFVFSWDSLVHVQPDALWPYTLEIARILRPGGRAFIHHSNFAEILSQHPPQEHAKLQIELGQGRASGVSASVFRQFCRRAGLAILSQEMHNWGNETLTDCISVVGRIENPPSSPKIIQNSAFKYEQQIAKHISTTYGQS